MLAGQASTAGVAFFIQHEDGGPIKIGEALDVEGLVRELNLNAHDPRYRLLATIPGGRAAERDLHVQFRHIRIHSNWFLPEPDLIAAIAEARAQHGHFGPVIDGLTQGERETLEREVQSAARVQPPSTSTAAPSTEQQPEKGRRTRRQREPRPTDLLTARDLANELGWPMHRAESLHRNICHRVGLVCFQGFRRYFIRREALEAVIDKYPKSHHVRRAAATATRTPKASDLLTSSDIAEMFGWPNSRAAALIRAITSDDAELHRIPGFRRNLVRRGDLDARTKTT